jgi:general secretion pathway protein F
MPAFEYAALDRGGHRHKGVLQGESSRAVRQDLRDRGLTPLSVEKLAPKSTHTLRALFEPRLSTEQLALTTRLLATLTKSGLPLDDALSALADQTEQAYVKRIVLGVRARLLEGQSLAASMDFFPQAFPTLYRATVAAGEQTRHLGTVLERLAEHTEETQQLRRKLQTALIYPMILSVTAILVVVGLLTYVVPGVVKVFAHMDKQLPWITRALIGLSTWLRHYGLVALLVLVACALMGHRLLRRPSIRRRLDELLLRLPLVRRLIRETHAATFARTLGILLQSGVSLVAALEIAKQGLASLPMRQAVEDATIKVREGVSLNQSLAQSKRGHRSTRRHARDRRESPRTRSGGHVGDLAGIARTGADFDDGPRCANDRDRHTATDLRIEPTGLVAWRTKETLIKSSCPPPRWGRAGERGLVQSFPKSDRLLTPTYSARWR